jgi:transcriptional regulator with XRE-family HTH domain
VTPSPSDTSSRRHCKGRASHEGHSGIVAGTVLRCARLSAGLSRQELAATMSVTEEMVRAWEEGSSPLASVPLPQVAILETSLRQAGANPRLVSDLAPASWCDLVILAIADREDISCLMADSVTRETAFTELLTWCLAEPVPHRYQPYADPAPLLTDPILADQAAQALALTGMVTLPTSSALGAQSRDLDEITEET